MDAEQHADARHAALRMRTRLVIHSGCHRGEVRRIMTRLSLPLPWDTFAACLHSTQPWPRLRCIGRLVSQRSAPSVKTR